MDPTASRELIGDPVDYVVFPGEAAFASHGEFRFHNASPTACKLHVRQAWFSENGQLRPLKLFHVYADDEEIRDSISVPPHGEVSFRVTFPFVPVSVGPGMHLGVVVAGHCDAEEYVATSRLLFSRERPHPGSTTP